MRGSLDIIRDSVHNLITFRGEEGAMIADLIDRPEFQRLRRIRQLGLGFMTYPGAEHSRWVHSLGVYHVARRMLDALRDRHGARSKEYKELSHLRKEILAAALLHDVGHGPFSHVFERAIHPPKNKLAGYPKDHEDWSQRIIHERLSGVLENHGVRVDVVVGLVDKTNRQHLLAKDFISSQLDADRIDYLLRDSHATGTKYGEFDLDWLLHSLRVGEVRVKGQRDSVRRLCFNGKAIHAIEEYIQAREFMYVQVYIHKATRAYEALLTNILGLATAIADGDQARVPQPCPPALSKMLARSPVDTAEYLALDDFRLWCTLVDWSSLDGKGGDRIRRLAEMCKRLVNREEPYRTIELKDRSQQDKALALVTSLREQDLRFSCCRDAFTDLAYKNVLYRKSKEGEEQEDRAILVQDRNDRTHPVESESEVILAISRIETAIYRLYYDGTDEALVDRLKTNGWLAEDGVSETPKQEGR